MVSGEGPPQRGRFAWGRQAVPTVWLGLLLCTRVAGRARLDPLAAQGEPGGLAAGWADSVGRPPAEGRGTLCRLRMTRLLQGLSLTEGDRQSTWLQA